MKTIEIELSDTAASVLTEMAKRGQVAPEAIARICVENSLSQAIDRLNAVDGDEWFMESAKNVNKTCLESWRDVRKPGDYETALKHVKSGRAGVRRRFNREVSEARKRKLCNYAEAGAVRFVDRTERAIVHLQDAVKAHFGPGVPLHEDCGQMTLYISPNRVEMIGANPGRGIIARSPAKTARILDQKLAKAAVA